MAAVLSRQLSARPQGATERAGGGRGDRPILNDKFEIVIEDLMVLAFHVHCPHCLSLCAALVCLLVLSSSARTRSLLPAMAVTSTRASAPRATACLTAPFLVTRGALASVIAY